MINRHNRSISNILLFSIKFTKKPSILSPICVGHIHAITVVGRMDNRNLGKPIMTAIKYKVLDIKILNGTILVEVEVCIETDADGAPI